MGITIEKFKNKFDSYIYLNLEKIIMFEDLDEEDDEIDFLEPYESEDSLEE